MVTDHWSVTPALASAVVRAIVQQISLAACSARDENSSLLTARGDLRAELERHATSCKHLEASLQALQASTTHLESDLQLSRNGVGAHGHNYSFKLLPTILSSWRSSHMCAAIKLFC